MSTRHAYASTRLGELLLVAEGEALIGVYFPGHTYPPAADAIGERVAINTDAIEDRVAINTHATEDRVVINTDAIGERVAINTAAIGERVDVNVAATNTAVTNDDAQDPAPDPSLDPLLTQAARELREYLAGERQQFVVPVEISGDPTSEVVWQYLLQIPYGETTTYGAIAAALGRPGLAQRVGQAVGHNPISIIIPCHRVLGADGSLTGYAGGLDRKRALLDLEEPEATQAGRLF